jgi:DNA-binding transcriptional MerR regulator
MISEKDCINIHKVVKITALARSTINRYVSLGIFVPHFKDKRDNRSNLFYEGSVQIRNTVRLKLIDRGYALKEIGMELRRMCGINDEKLLDAIGKGDDSEKLVVRLLGEMQRNSRAKERKSKTI